MPAMDREGDGYAVFAEQRRGQSLVRREGGRGGQLASLDETICSEPLRARPARDGCCGCPGEGPRRVSNAISAQVPRERLHRVSRDQTGLLGRCIAGDRSYPDNEKLIAFSCGSKGDCRLYRREMPGNGDPLSRTGGTMAFKIGTVFKSAGFPRQPSFP